MSEDSRSKEATSNRKGHLLSALEFFCSSFLLSSLELSDTKVYEP